MTVTAPSATSSAAPQAPRRRRRVRPGTVVQYLVLVAMFLLLAGPLVWQLSLSLKGAGDDLYARPPQLVPTDPTLTNFAEVLDRVPVLHYVGNSVVVAAFVVGGNVVGATLAGYALARLRFRGRSLVLGLLLTAMLVPVETVIVSQFLLVRSMQLQNTLLGVALPTLITALNVFLMRNAFAAIPKELEEAATIDGANAWQRFLRICVPQVKGVITVVAIFSFVGAWNDFLWPLIVLSDDSQYTLTVGLNRLRGTFYDDPRLIAAGTVVALVPIVAFFALLQRYFFRGLESGGLKG
ncbi:carbohydrate ABC transporter permease [Georgenia sp. TF02-10]|uniref:carbohydrate ABC transporter permease n=1 Tax=Georgenia sp. TF02-10 TaxID=2917725 RepID=UPI001FA7FBEA|nr:carbohydrate ABC transporter permease [Georgenia sp. TF02-10]UNX56525.1 carbohydrate ABC transporter permease [Georgenia sp. TF02-10]